MAMAREPWAMQIDTTEPRMGKRGGPSTGRPRNFDSSTCAAGEQETLRSEVVSLDFSSVLTGEFLYAHSPRRTTSVEIRGVSR